MNSYTIQNAEHPTRPGLVVLDDDGNQLGIVYTQSRISASSDSGLVVDECSEFVLGDVVSIEHDRDVIHVTAS